MRIGIVGYGVVGKALRNFFQRASHQICVFDKFLLGLNGTSEQAAVNACDVTFIAVPTPTTEKESFHDLTAVIEAVEWIRSPICIRSTILPGTTQLLQSQYGKDIAFSPEYLGESPHHPWRTEEACGYLVVGGSSGLTERIFDAYRPAVSDTFSFFRTDATTAELCKYMENCFLATKVAFVNQFFDIATALQVDFEQLRQLWLLDARIGHSHTLVTRERGFGGRCLPKDLVAFSKFMRARGGAPLLDAVIAFNDAVRGEALVPPNSKEAAPGGTD
jgi:UDPglucose 6-dehydrogenase